MNDVCPVAVVASNIVLAGGDGRPFFCLKEGQPLTRDWRQGGKH